MDPNSDFDLSGLSWSFENQGMKIYLIIQVFDGK